LCSLSVAEAELSKGVILFIAILTETVATVKEASVTASDTADIVVTATRAEAIALAALSPTSSPLNVNNEEIEIRSLGAANGVNSFMCRKRYGLGKELHFKHMTTFNP